MPGTTTPGTTTPGSCLDVAIAKKSQNSLSICSTFGTIFAKLRATDGRETFCSVLLGVHRKFWLLFKENLSPRLFKIVQSGHTDRR